MAKISVISPIYNVEKFIKRCAESLMQQTLEDVEFIFVNDCTPDGSISVLQSVINKYPNRNVKILNHEINKGLPSARNTGLDSATGDYIFHCDSDDFVEFDLLEKLYNTAIQNDAEIVWSDYYLSFQNSERYMHQPNYATATEALSGMMAGKMKYNVWNKLVKRSLYTDNNISFPAGYSMGEDMTMMMLFVHAQKVAYVPLALYHYIQWNPNALTFGGDCVRHLNLLEYNTNRISDYVKKHSSKDMSVDIAALRLNTKWPFLLDGQKSSFNRWRAWFNDADAFIWKVPEVSKRMKFVEWAASKGQFWIVWLHYILVIKIFYSVVYR